MIETVLREWNAPFTVTPFAMRIRFTSGGTCQMNDLIPALAKLISPEPLKRSDAVALSQLNWPEYADRSCSRD